MSKFETLSPKYSASVSADAGVALGAHAHTARVRTDSITYAVKIASVFFVVDLTFGECTAEILLSLSGTHSPLCGMFFISFFYLSVLFEDICVSVRISIAGSLNRRKGFG